ncbi:MAG: sigma-54-dependent Fis family transcriptional regulator [Acidobacteria bacterium]|nr:sigma-54-dependent Fis family transcriptional regulator [Acidobacteriota bacterium]
MKKDGAADLAPSWSNLEAVFESLGRVLITLDAQFVIIRASHTLDALAGEGAAASVIGKPIESLIGARLFGPEDSLREALRAGRREEGRRGVLHCGEDAARLVSVTTAPVAENVMNACDPRARYLVVLRPAEDDDSLLQSAIASHGLVARSLPMMRIVHLVESLHRSDATVLITGESGTGKEVIARALHAQSTHGAGPFVPVNCAALPGELLESELFGHVRGAFTGAVKDRVGRLEMAHGGTLFLDEAAEIPPGIQVKLLRVLQDRVFERVGESTPRRLGARIIAATNADLHDAILQGKLREDFYYRLRVVPIHIPPLRERTVDIELIARHLLARIGGREGRALRLSSDTLSVLEAFPWPGNVRELENALEYAVAVCRGQTIHVEDLPIEIRTAPGAPVQAVPAPEPAGLTLPAGGEAQRIRASLERNMWNRSKTALELGMSRTTLWHKMRELRIGPSAG